MAKKIKSDQTNKTVRAVGLPDIAKKIMNRSYQRAGVVAGGNLLSSGARRVTVTFPAQPHTSKSST
jgi:hypothetical protein